MQLSDGDDLEIKRKWVAFVLKWKQNKIEHSMNTSKMPQDLRLQMEYKQNSNNYNDLKYILYDFESTILYHSLYEWTQGSIDNMEQMDIDDFVKIFGMRDRISRLSQHFEQIKYNNIYIGIFIASHDVYYKDLVIASLKKIYLYQYIDFILETKDIESKMSHIHQLNSKNKLKHDELLLIDGHKHDIQLISNHCLTMYVSNKYGLTLRNIEDLEPKLAISISSDSTFTSNVQMPISSINVRVFRSMIQQILKADYWCNIAEIDIIQWIRKQRQWKQCLVL